MQHEGLLQSDVNFSKTYTGAAIHPLFDQPAVREKILKFLSDIASANCPICSTCLEQFPGMKLHCDGTECPRCSRNMVQMVITRARK